jgi:hypothetical protein
MEKRLCIGLLLCPKSVKNGQIITDLSKTVHFGKYYFNKLQLNLRNNYIFFRIFRNFSKLIFRKILKKNMFEKFRKRTTSTYMAYQVV